MRIYLIYTFDKRKEVLIMQFVDSEHKRFYIECMRHAKREDSYHKAVFYTLGISPDTRCHIHDVFDFDNDRIKLEGLNEGWQTSGSLKTTLFAFNMWNGYADESLPSTPYDLFCCDSAPYFFEAVKLKYPEYCPAVNKNAINHDAR